MDLVPKVSGLSLAASGLAVLLVLCVALYLSGVPLPHDQRFNAVVYLMWSGNQDDGWVVGRIMSALLLIDIAMATLLLVGALILQGEWKRYRRLLLRTRQDGLLLGAWLLAAINLSRYIANVVYEASRAVTWDVTPAIASVEGPYLEALQAIARSATTSELAAWLYSVGWYVPMILAGPLALLLARSDMALRLLLVSVLTAVLAIPVFLALPVFDPWALNPVYGYNGPGAVAVTYAYPGANQAALQFVSTKLRWATGSCLPSLHVVFPLAYGLVLWRGRLRALGVVYWLVAGLTAGAVVILGRHWMVDVILALPYAIAIVALTDRLAPLVHLRQMGIE